MLIPHIDPTAMPWDLIETQLESFGTAAAIYYSGGSCWWSHHRGHALITPDMKDPIGRQIFAEKDWRGWLEAARETPQHYGAHGLQALLAAHHTNCRNPETGGFYAARTWKPYNAALDLLAAEEAKLREKPKRIDLTAPKKTAFANPRKARRG